MNRADFDVEAPVPVTVLVEVTGSGAHALVRDLKIDVGAI
jgi:hypothetical protein